MPVNTEGDDCEIDDEDEEQRLIQSKMNGGSQVQHSVNNLGTQAGIILVCHPDLLLRLWLTRLFLGKGLHNICIVIQQFKVTGMSSVILALFDPDKSVVHHGKVQDAPIPVPTAGSAVPGVDPNMRFARPEGVGGGASGGSIGLLFK